MRAGRELDVLVAEKVMGWRLVNYDTNKPARTKKDYAAASVNDGWFWEGRDTSAEAHQWHPSTDISAAWEVVTKLELLNGNLLTFHEKRREWVIGFTDYDGNIQVEAAGDTPMLAICLAGLAEVES